MSFPDSNGESCPDSKFPELGSLAYGTRALGILIHVHKLPSSLRPSAGLSADRVSARPTHRAPGRSLRAGCFPWTSRPRAVAGPSRAARGQVRMTSRDRSRAQPPCQAPWGQRVEDTSNPRAAAERPSSQGLCQAHLGPSRPLSSPSPLAGCPSSVPSALATG